MTSVQHIFFKLSIKDIHEAKYNSSKECFQCYLDRAEPKLSLNFKKVRICGSICEFSDNYFYVDDGTATIKVIYSEDNLETDETQLQLGDYVEILGNVTEDYPYSIISSIITIKSDPMDEVKHLLELAAIYKDFKAYYLPNSFLSSDESDETVNEKH